MQKHPKHLHAFLISWLVLSMPLMAVSGSSARNNSSREVQAANSFQQKLDRIQENSRREPPTALQTVFRQDEINAYFAQRRLKIPEGVKSVHFELKSGMVTALTRVDFDEIASNRKSWNPLLALFTGVHDAEVVAHAHGADGVVQVDVDSVSIDGINVPRAALQLFIEKFVQPKFPSVRLNGLYRLPAKLDTAVIKQGEGVVTQR